jgi:hypothetical protein
MDPIVLGSSRSNTRAAFVAAGLLGLVGVVTVASGALAGIGLLVIAAVALVAGIAGRRKSKTFLRVDDEGVTVKGTGLDRKTPWPEIESFEPTTVRLGRHTGKVPCVRIHFQNGFERTNGHEVLGRDPRYVMASYGNLSNVELADLLNTQLVAHR